MDFAQVSHVRWRTRRGSSRTRPPSDGGHSGVAAASETRLKTTALPRLASSKTKIAPSCRRAGGFSSIAGATAFLLRRPRPFANFRPMLKLEDVDWKTWQAKDEATLLFVVEPERVLLIHKKRGLGAGKVNAPGGRLEPGETPEQCAVREVQEELCVTPTGLEKRGELAFQFSDGYSIFVHVFLASGHLGIPTETAEARPQWTSLAAIPYARMWEDDALWVPWLLQGRFFSGRFLFDGESMLDHQLAEHASGKALLDPKVSR